MPAKKQGPASTSSSGLQQLRDDAEAILDRAPLAAAPVRPVAELVHELQVHQIELQMQNEALRQSQLALEESRDHYVDLYEFAPVAYLTLSRDGNIDAINLTGTTLLGESRSKLLHRRLDRFVVPDDRDRWHRHFSYAFQHDGKPSCELSFTRHDGSVFAASLDCLRTTTGGENTTLRVTLTDISPRKAAEVALHEANQSLESLVAEQVAYLSELASDLTLSEQRERDRLHDLLHDEMQPLLVAARLMLSGLGPTSSPKDCLRVAAETCQHIGQVIQVARTLGIQLCPPLIREHGLIPGLDSLCRWVKGNYGLVVELRTVPAAEPADVAMRLVCFNAVRELLMNVVKHAGATHASVKLTLLDGDTLLIDVADAGRGFDPSAIVNGSGLAGINRRLGMFGGGSKIVSDPGQGTVVSLTIPLRQAKAEGWGDGSRNRRVSHHRSMVRKVLAERAAEQQGERASDAEDTDCR